MGIGDFLIAQVGILAERRIDPEPDRKTVLNKPLRLGALRTAAEPQDQGHSQCHRYK